MEDLLPVQSDDNANDVDYQNELSQDRYHSLRIRTCKRCKYSTTSAKEFLHHQVSEHTDGETHPCDRCPFEAATYLDLVGHKRTEHRRPPATSGALISGTRSAMENPSGMINEANNNEKIVAQDKVPSPMLPPGEYKANHHNDHQAGGSSPEGADDAIEVFECGLCSFATTKASDLKAHQIKHRIEQPKLFDTSFREKSSGHHGDHISVANSEYEIMQRSYLSSHNGMRNNEIKPDDGEDNQLIIDESMPKTIIVNSHPSHVTRPKTVYATPATGLPHRAKPGPKPGTTGSAVRPRTGCAPVREAVDPAKYITIQEPDGIKYACSKCGNIYKWRKSLNKHWKEKHDGEIPDPRPNLTALNIPRLGKGYVTGLPNGKGNIISFMGTQQHQQRGGRAFQSKMPGAAGPTLMSGGDVSLNSSEIRKVLKRPAMTNVAGSPKAVETAHGGLAKSSPMMRYAGRLQEGSHMMQPSKMACLSDDRPVAHYVPSTVVSYGKYRNATVTEKPATPPRSQASKSTPIDLSRQQLGYSGTESSQSTRTEDILDLSKKPSDATAPAQRVIDIDLEQLPPQDEPLDFSMKSSQARDATKTEKKGFGVVPEEVKSLSLQCPSCAYSASSMQDYDTHMELHLRKQHYKCAECQDVFVTMDSLNEHFLSGHPDVIQQQVASVGKDGIYRQSKVPESTQLYKYLTMDSQNQLLSCMVCGAIFQWQWTLAKHFEQHHQLITNPYKKKPSPATTSTAASASPPASGDESLINVKSDCDATSIQCSQCSFTAASSSELAKHQLKHSISRQYVCSICSYITRWKDQLFSHYKQEHPTSDVDLNQLQSIGDPAPDSDTDGNVLNSKPYIDLTDKDTAIVFPQAPEDTDFGCSPGQEGKRKRGEDSSSSSSNAEMLLPFKCMVCEYRARWPSEITQHMKNHSDQKPYLCPRCSYRSKWKWDVVKHLKRCGGGTVNDVIDTTKTTRSHNMQALLSDASSSPQNAGMSLTQQRELLSNGPPNVTVLPSAKRDDATSSDASDAAVCGDSAAAKPSTSDGATVQNDEARSASPKSESSSQSYHVCLHCPFVGNSPAELKRHCRVHSDEKPFICKTCGYCSKWKCDLKKHLRTYKHTSAVPLTYGGHGRKPSDWNELKGLEGEENSDEESNDGDAQNDADDECSQKTEQPPLYKCDKCQYVTYKKNFMDSHIKIHRNSSSQNQAAKLKCKQCDFEASDLPAFLQHKLSHSQGGEASQTPPSDSGSIDSSPGTRHRRKATKQHHIMRSAAAEEMMDVDGDQSGTGDVGGEEEKESHDSSKPVDFSQKTPPAVPANPPSQDQKVAKSSGTKTSIYKCTHCPYNTDNRNNYEKHVKFHNTQNKYVCEWCNWSIDRLNLLYRHAQTVHPNELAHQEKETFYGKVKRRKSSDSQLKDEGDELDVKCDSDDTIEEESTGHHMSWSKCQDMSNIEKRRLEARWETIGSEEDLPPELRCKRRRRLKTCTKCGYITDNVTTLQRHMAKHGSKGKFTCDYCDYSVDRQHIVDYHIKIVHQTGMKPTDFELDGHDDDEPGDDLAGEENEDLGEMSDSESMHDDEAHVDKHEMDADDKNQEVVWEVTKIKGHEMKVQRIGRRTTYHCLKCPFYTCNITNAVNHIKQHGLGKKYTCELCDYSLDQLRHIMHHMKKVHGHDADLSFSDNNDDGDDMFSDALAVSGKPAASTTKRREASSHGKVKSQKATGQRMIKGGLSMAKKSRSQRRYPCRQCQFVARGAAALRKHMTSHKRFGAKIQCGTCRYTASTPRLLQIHVKSHHGHDG